MSLTSSRLRRRATLRKHLLEMKENKTKLKKRGRGPKQSCADIDAASGSVSDSSSEDPAAKRKRRYAKKTERIKRMSKEEKQRLRLSIAEAKKEERLSTAERKKRGACEGGSRESSRS